MTLITAPTTTASGSEIKVRFCPSPTGTPHVGLVRTALFNWAYARRVGGTFVFRIEDTDAARDSEESYHQIIDALRWLGMDWDEGVEVGGPHEPYRQSQRTEIYMDVIDKLKESGHVYESFLSAEEIEERNKANGRAVQLGYDNSERELSQAGCHRPAAGAAGEGGRRGAASGHRRLPRPAAGQRVRNGRGGDGARRRIGVTR